MKTDRCEHERAVRDAAAEGRWTVELASHAADCRSCADLALVMTFLSRNREDARIEKLLPDPAMIWWRARLNARAERAERATWMIPALQRLALGCGLLVPALAVARWWHTIASWLDALTPDALVSAGAASPVLVVVGSLGVLALLALFDFTHVGE